MSRRHRYPPRPCSTGSVGGSSVRVRSSTDPTVHAGSPTPITRRLGGLWISSRTSSASTCYRATPTPTPRAPAPDCRPRCCGEDARRIIHDAVGGTEDDLVLFCGSGATAAVNKLVDILGLRVPSGLAKRYRLAGEQIPERRTSGGVRWSLRAPLQRVAVAGVHRRAGGDRRRRRRSYRSGTTGAAADPLRGPATAHRQLLGRLQCHRGAVRRRPDRHPAARARRVVLLGLRRCRTLRPDPDAGQRCRPR